MGEIAGVRKELRQAVGQEVPDEILEDRDIRDWTREYLKAKSDTEWSDAWGALVDAVQRALRFWNAGREKGLKGVQSGARVGSQDMRRAQERDSGGRRGLDPRELVSDTTKAMTGAMTALFAIIGDQLPEIKEFRARILADHFLSADEAHALMASGVARIFDLRLFEKWNIPIVGHDWEIIEHNTGSDRGGVYMRATVRVDPPGITRTVRYADAYNSLEEEDVADTRALVQSGAVVPLITGLPIAKQGNHTYPDWLWPGSVVDKLYDLSVDLASAFDWPLAPVGNLWGTRPRSDSAAWFILTGEAPEGRPIEARWESKHGSTHLSPQWRIRLTIPPWLSDEEVSRAVKTLRSQKPEGRQMPYTATARPLEVARFVWERERLDGYRDPPPWTEWVKHWNDEHPGHRFKSASNFRTYFFRGDEAVKHLNFDWPNFG